MEIDRIKRLEILDDEGIFERIENGSWHTPYEQEILLYSAISSGDVNRLIRVIDTMLENGVSVGRMSSDNLRQTQYLAVSCIALATRYAIQGGLPQSEAYAFSDKCLMHIDTLGTPEEIYVYLFNSAGELCEMVHNAKKNIDYPSAVKDCIAYIEKNITGKITLDDLGKHCALRGDYISRIFKQATGKTVSAYITDMKLETAKSMLNGKYNYSSIGYYLGFSSESYFISCFKKKYGLTPRQYAESLGY
ncbi:MAG: helix-turn-helix transcriptional regulator [Clostridia bacterium]|nr:helix-turn-helix transcriptional regulator [Clostridia bacterium]